MTPFYTFQGLIINVSFNDLLLHNLFIPFVQNIKTSKEIRCTIMRFSYTFKLVLIIHFIQMKWHALKLEANIMPQIWSNKQHFEPYFVMKEYIRIYRLSSMINIRNVFRKATYYWKRYCIQQKWETNCASWWIIKWFFVWMWQVLRNYVLLFVRQKSSKHHQLSDKDHTIIS